jgi:hypothetical protein
VKRSKNRLTTKIAIVIRSKSTTERKQRRGDGMIGRMITKKELGIVMANDISLYS